MVSFRLSTQEYDSFRQLCIAHGLRSFSELARAGVHLLLEKSADTPQRALESRIGIVETRLRMMGLEIDRLSKILEESECCRIRNGGSAYQR
jgi:hypothetical protein